MATTGHAQSAVFAVMQRDAAAVRFGDLAGEGKAKTCAIALGRIERHQCVVQYRFVHAVAAVEHLDA